MTRPEKTVFLSYAQVDRGYAEALARALATSGTSIWYDREIAAGADWDSEIQNALRRASVVVLVLSRASLASQYVNYEIGSAISAGIPVIPVLVGDVESLPYHLRHIQAVDARGLDTAMVGVMVAKAVAQLTG
jgi:hypothetical protein